jgi:glutamyl-tRNA synthetase
MFVYRVMISEDLIKAYALENAILHDGKARVDVVIAKLFRHGLHKDDIPNYLPKIKEIVENVNRLSIKEQKEEFEILKHLIPEKTKTRELELPNVKDKVVMRLAPFPSGPLHIGNARPYVLNDFFVKKYGGKLLLVIDDTIGSKEKRIVEEAYKLIPEGLKWLGINFEEPIVYKSDRLEIYYRYGEKLIQKGFAYVCFCNQEELRKNREKGIECEHRAYGIKENLKEWENMLNGKYKEGEATLRIKTSMKHKNPAFRDRVLFRISAMQHPRLKNKEAVVWPMMEMAWAIDDYLLGITHILRGKELMIETEMEKYIFDIFEWPKPEFVHTSLLNIEGIKLSKSKSQEEIAKGVYFGWDDPRTWSLQSLKRRGFKPEAIRDFCLSFGLSESEVKVPLDVLYSFNRKYLEESNRCFFIANPILIKIENAPELKARLPVHPSHPERGERVLYSSNEFFISLDDYREIRKAREGSVFRLMHLLNFYKKDEKFYFHSIEIDKAKEVKKIHWLPAENYLDARVLMPNGEWVNGILENVNIEVDQTLQFERFGFVRLDDIKKIKSNKKYKKIYEFWYAHP